ncbi:hypothetical protein ACFWAP_03980 [Streptomyces goshikiensis]|uniref:hypothetical protein n=1 Tax=Streptomyces goshikiensis TaxID=1942 RepID=UPI00364B3951
MLGGAQLVRRRVLHDLGWPDHRHRGLLCGRADAVLQAGEGHLRSPPWGRSGGGRGTSRTRRAARP